MHVFIALAILASTRSAPAQVMATPYLHANFGDVEIRRGGPGLSAGYLGRRVGFELDVDRHHHFYKDRDLLAIPNPCRRGAVGPCVDNDTDAWIFMVNAVVPAPIPATSHWRPYGAAGLGVIYAWVHDAGPYDSYQTHLAFDLGGGVTYRLLDWLALRGDVRYFHAFVGDEPDGGYAGDYDFGRVLLGVTFAAARPAE